MSSWEIQSNNPLLNPLLLLIAPIPIATMRIHIFDCSFCNRMSCCRCSSRARRSSPYCTCRSRRTSSYCCCRIFVSSRLARSSSAYCPIIASRNVSLLSFLLGRNNTLYYGVVTDGKDLLGVSPFVFVVKKWRDLFVIGIRPFKFVIHMLKNLRQRRKNLREGSTTLPQPQI